MIDIAVSMSLANEIFFIELWHVLSLILSLCVNYYIYLKARKSYALYAYLLTQAMLLIWIVAKIFKTVSTTIEIRWLFIVIQYFGVTFLGAFLLVFAYVYVKSKLPRPLLIVLIFLPALASFLIVATNPLHYAFYSKFTFYSDSFGSLFYLTMAVSYIYLLISIILLSRGFMKMFGVERIRAVLFGMAILLPFIANVFYVFRLPKLLWGITPLFDYTPIATNLSLMLFMLGALKYRFFDILPMAKKQIFDALSDAVVICGKGNKVSAFNQSAALIFPNIKKNDCFRLSNESLELNQRTYKVFKNSFKSFEIYRLKDSSEINRMLMEAQTKNAELSETKEKLEHILARKKDLTALIAKNYILQELHDVLGHSVVLAISACEIEAINEADNYNNTLFSIKKLLIESQAELINALESGTKIERRTSLMIAVDSIISNAVTSRVKVDSTVLGSPFELVSGTSKAIFRMCQEAITNSIKHSDSDEIHIVLRYNENELEVFIMDNGQGCEEIIYGKGLLGMQERIKKTGGQIKFSSGKDCGFRIYAKVKRSIDDLSNDIT